MGTPLFELYECVRRAKHIWNAFNDEFANAPSRVRELVETCDCLSRVLSDYTSLLERYNETYPQERSFQRKLAECEIFLTRYKTLRAGHLQSNTSRLTWIEIWETTKYAYDDNRAKELRDTLSLEIQTLLTCMVVFGLKRDAGRTLSRPDASSRFPIADPRQREEVTRLRRQVAGFQNIFQELLVIRYSFEREMSYCAVQRDRRPNIEPLRERLEDVWHRLYVRSGLIPEGGPTPPLPREPQELLNAPSRNFDALVINTAGPSIHGEFRTSTDVTRLAPRTNRVRPNAPNVVSHPPSIYENSLAGRRTSSVPTIYSEYGRSISTATTAQTTPYLNAEQSGAPAVVESFLPQAATSAPIASITLPYTQPPVILQLCGWTIQSEVASRWIEWTTESPADVLYHVLPTPTYPHSHHSKSAQRLFVTFDELHTVTLVRRGTPIYDRPIAPEYCFKEGHQDERDLLQGGIRGVDHVDAFDIDIIWSNIHKEKDNWKHFAGMARSVKLTLWRSKLYPYHHSFSFIGNTSSGNQHEFALSAFKCPPTYTEHRVVRLDCVGVERRTSSTPSGSIHNLVRRFSRRLSDQPTDMPLPEPTSPASPQAEGHVSGGPQLSHLCIRFSSKTECDRFKTRYEAACAEEQSPPEPRYPEHRAELAVDSETLKPQELDGRELIYELESPTKYELPSPTTPSSTSKIRYMY